MNDGAVITFLGSGDAFGSGGRLQTCFHVKTAQASFLIDCGATVCPAMKRFGVCADDVDAILVSHFHADHFAGVPFLLLEGKVGGRTRPLSLAGPRGLSSAVERTTDVLFPGAGGDYPFALHCVEYVAGRVIDVAGIRVTAFPVLHAPATHPHALRIEAGGRTIAYSGDTEWTDALIELARDADVFICEMSGFDRPVGIHLDFATLQRHRSALSCRRLVLTHLGEGVIANGDRIGRELDAQLADDGLVLSI